MTKQISDRSSQKEKPITLEVVLRNWDKEEGRITKYIYQFSDEHKYLKITTSEGHTKVLIDTGYFAHPKSGLIISSKRVVIPPEGLIIRI